MGCHFLLQGIFPPQGLNLGLLLYRQILYHLNFQGGPQSCIIQPSGTPTIMCNSDNWCEAVIEHRESILVLCDGWDGRGEGCSKGGDIYIIMTDSCYFRQKPAHYCKAIILQLKNKRLKKSFKKRFF